MTDEDSTLATIGHILLVQEILGGCISELLERARLHDATKLEEPEKGTFDKYTPKLKGVTYGSEDYRRFLEGMRPALEHHYAHNRHHPEHGDGTLKWMTLIDLLEMLVDWLAATKRHDDGDIGRSIEVNQERFGYGDEMKQILLNTVDWLEMGGEVKR